MRVLVLSKLPEPPRNLFLAGKNPLASLLPKCLLRERDRLLQLSVLVEVSGGRREQTLRRCCSTLLVTENGSVFWFDHAHRQSNIEVFVIAAAWNATRQSETIIEYKLCDGQCYDRERK